MAGREAAELNSGVVSVIEGLGGGNLSGKSPRPLADDECFSCCGQSVPCEDAPCPGNKITEASPKRGDAFPASIAEELRFESPALRSCTAGRLSIKTLESTKESRVKLWFDGKCSRFLSCQKADVGNSTARA